MHEKLKSFLDAQKEAEVKAYEARKHETLVDLGLYEREYSPSGKYSEEYPFCEWDVDRHASIYFKKVPIEITDEEYQEVKKYAKTEDKENGAKNPVAVALTIIAWIIFIGGFISGIALGWVEVEMGREFVRTYSEFSFESAFVYWCTSLISGTVFLGFAEIIKLLTAIKRK